MKRFNYIVTIHNKEDLIEKVIMSLLLCMRGNSHIYAVVDGCTDRTEQIIDELIDYYTGIPITKIITNDVHEIRSINAGLRQAPIDDGFNISLQDDVIIADYNFEQKVEALYAHYGKRLGYVSFRHAANLRHGKRGELAIVQEDIVENICGAALPDATIIQPGHVAFRMAAIKSPTCIPSYLLQDIGLLDEDLAPYSWDDHEYSIRALKAGYINAVYPIKFISRIEWGGVRRTPHPEMGEYYARNTRLVYKKHKEFLDSYIIGDQMKTYEEFGETMPVLPDTVYVSYTPLTPLKKNKLRIGKPLAIKSIKKLRLYPLLRKVRRR